MKLILCSLLAATLSCAPALAADPDCRKLENGVPCVIPPPATPQADVIRKERAILTPLEGGFTPAACAALLYLPARFASPTAPECSDGCAARDRYRNYL